ncbi:MAG TPA: hypothetical protein VE465_12025 [Streptosporangiaceae bacterium]|nr:hypothetical protein [Streptosporangiaceae bacterium]
MRIGAAVTVVGCAAGVALPALFARPAWSAPKDLRLVTTIVTTARTVVGDAEFIDFTVTVRAIGGSARGVGVTAAIEPAATWVAVPSICRTGRNGGRLRCALGDVSGRTDLDLAARVPRPPGPTAPPVLVTVTTTSSATAETTVAAPSATSSARSPRSPVSAARPPGSRRGASHSAGAHQPKAAGRPGRPGHRGDAPLRPGRPPAVPEPPVALEPPAVPPPVAPLPSVAPPPPPASGDAAAPGAAWPSPSDPALVLPEAGTSPPAAGPQAGQDPSMIDPPQLSIVRAEPVAGSRRAWVTVLAITIVFETAVLWLAACLTLWRRRATPTHAPSGGLTAWLRSVLRAVWAPLARLPRVLDGLRR